MLSRQQADIDLETTTKYQPTNIKYWSNFYYYYLYIFSVTDFYFQINPINDISFLLIIFQLYYSIFMKGIYFPEKKVVENIKFN